jgi:hypothetical protein
MYVWVNLSAGRASRPTLPAASREPELAAPGRLHLQLYDFLCVSLHCSALHCTALHCSFLRATAVQMYRELAEQKAEKEARAKEMQPRDRDYASEHTAAVAAARCAQEGSGPAVLRCASLHVLRSAVPGC